VSYTPVPEVAPADDVAEDRELLLSFVHERDVECPRCGYNLRNLTQPVCPECSERLILHVGLAEPKLGWFLAAIAPGIFAGILAIVILVMIVTIPGAPSEVIITELFLVCSGVVGIGIIVGQRRFRAQSRQRQAAVAIGYWIAHVIAFVWFMQVIR